MTDIKENQHDTTFYKRINTDNAGANNFLISLKGILRLTSDEDQKKFLSTMIEGLEKTSTVTKALQEEFLGFLVKLESPADTKRFSAALKALSTLPGHALRDLIIEDAKKDQILRMVAAIAYWQNDEDWIRSWGDDEEYHSGSLSPSSYMPLAKSAATIAASGKDPAYLIAYNFFVTTPDKNVIDLRYAAYQKMQEEQIAKEHPSYSSETVKKEATTRTEHLIKLEGLSNLLEAREDRKLYTYLTFKS